MITSQSIQDELAKHAALINLARDEKLVYHNRFGELVDASRFVQRIAHELELRAGRENINQARVKALVRDLRDTQAEWEGRAA